MLLAHQIKILAHRGLFRNVLRISNRGVSKQEMRAQRVLDELYTSLQLQKFEDIIVIKTKFEVNPRFLVIANAFSEKHLVKATEEVNKSFKLEIKTEDEEFAKLGIAKEWNVLDFKSVVVHLLTRKCRNQFDIEQLWTVGEKYDDFTNIKPDSQSLEVSELYDSDNRI